MRWNICELRAQEAPARTVLAKLARERRCTGARTLRIGVFLEPLRIDARNPDPSILLARTSRLFQITPRPTRSMHHPLRKLLNWILIENDRDSFRRAELRQLQPRRIRAVGRSVRVSRRSVALRMCKNYKKIADVREIRNFPRLLFLSRDSDLRRSGY